MTPLELFKTWLATVPLATTFNLSLGHWTDFETSIAKRFIAYHVVGGAAPRELFTRQVQISVTIVGALDESSAAISALAENIVRHAHDVPPQCDIVAVNMVGEVIGPQRTTAGRPILTMTLTIII